MTGDRLFRAGLEPGAVERYLAGDARDAADADEYSPTLAAAESAEAIETQARCDAVMALAAKLASAPDLQWAYDEAAAIARSGPQRAVPARRWFERAGLAWGVAASAASLAAVVAVMSLWSTPRLATDETPIAATNVTIAPVIIPAAFASRLAEVDPVVMIANQVPVDGRSIAVLPFSGDTATEGTADVGLDRMATAIYRRLMQQLEAIPGLYVIEPNVAAAYVDSDLTPEQIAAYLGVRGIVQGHLNADGDNVELGLRFTDAAGDGSAIEKSIAASGEQIALIENDITTSVLDALSISRKSQAAQQL